MRRVAPAKRINVVRDPANEKHKAYMGFVDNLKKNEYSVYSLRFIVCAFRSLYNLFQHNNYTI